MVKITIELGMSGMLRKQLEQGSLNAIGSLN